jgi:hypothetical protein
MVDKAGDRSLPAGNASVPRCTICGGCLANGRCRYANDADEYEVGVLNEEFLLVRLFDPIKVSLKTNKMEKATEAYKIRWSRVSRCFRNMVPDDGQTACEALCDGKDQTIGAESNQRLTRGPAQTATTYIRKW